MWELSSGIGLFHLSRQTLPHQENSPASHSKSSLCISKRDTDLNYTFGSKRSSLFKPKRVSGNDTVAAVSLAMPSSWPEGAASVEKGIMSVGY